MFTVTFDEYILCLGEHLPELYTNYRKHAKLVEEIDFSHTQRAIYFVAVKKRLDWPFLVVAQRYSPDGDAGFHPGAFIVPETHLLFIGAGERLLAYRLDVPEKLWEDSTELGFFGWERHKNFVIMSAELELAVWDIAGQKLWSRFVEPPWDYTLDGDTLQLDVMGTKSTLSLRSGSQSSA